MSKVEVIVLNEEDAKLAEAYGADRLELVSAIAEGGLTPSYGTIKRVVNSVQIPVMVMIRPHSYSFQYKKAEWEVMREDIRVARDLGADGIVFGALTEGKKVDVDLLSMIVEEAEDMSVTFHRAIDEAEPLSVYESLCQAPLLINQVLTSGGKPTVMEGLPTLRTLIEASRMNEGQPSIMPGAGLDLSNIESIHHQLQADEYHFGSGVRVGREFQNSIDGTVLQKIKEIVK